MKFKVSILPFRITDLIAMEKALNVDDFFSRDPDCGMDEAIDHIPEAHIWRRRLHSLSQSHEMSPSGSLESEPLLCTDSAYSPTMEYASLASFVDNQSLPLAVKQETSRLMQFMRISDTPDIGEASTLTKTTEDITTGIRHRCMSLPPRLTPDIGNHYAGALGESNDLLENRTPFKTDGWPDFDVLAERRRSNFSRASSFSNAISRQQQNSPTAILYRRALQRQQQAQASGVQTPPPSERMSSRPVISWATPQRRRKMNLFVQKCFSSPLNRDAKTADFEKDLKRTGSHAAITCGYITPSTSPYEEAKKQLER